jgi:nanoRNase/pAp phosphatase (c-di-AMP/oligoRNAs hydrolase)
MPTELNVSEIAQKFGGGGHMAAAGADVKGKLDEVLLRALTYTRDYMKIDNKTFHGEIKV